MGRISLTQAAVLALVVLFSGACYFCPLADVTPAPAASAPAPAPEVTLASLGEKLFFDRSLSEPPGQSCASCHAPETGWTGPDEAVNQSGGVYPGAVVERFGNRKPPSVAYANAPSLAARMEGGRISFSGGSFWDGRATGEKLGSPLAEQALGPFLNPLEQNLPSGAAVVSRVCSGPYASLLREVARRAHGLADACDPAAADGAYEVIGFAIAAFETSPKVESFSSRYDLVLAGKAVLTPQEARGLALFAGKARCASCHPHSRGPKGEPPLFTDFTYDNLGLPPNPANPFYGMSVSYNPAGRAFRDPGLGGALSEDPRHAMHADDNTGRHKVPTLRNVNKRPARGFVKAYGHNGVFKSLEEVVHFYNTRDVLGECRKSRAPSPGYNCWAAPEIARNVNRADLGNLELSREEEAAIVAFLKTLDDGAAAP